MVRLPRIRRSAKVAVVAVALVSAAEGLRTYAYEDPVGIPTICFGETRGVELGDTATPAQCEAMLAGRLVEFSREVDGCLKARVPDETYAAILSFAYNVGADRFCRSTMARKANAGDLRGACDELPRWNKAGGVVWPGLTKRRADERALCLKGIEAAS